MKKIKLIWDFKGPNAERIAEHHMIHLKEFMAFENLNYFDIGLQKPSEYHVIAIMVVTEDLVPSLRERLKPHRGQLYQE